MSPVVEVLDHRDQALAHLRRKGFGDVADDAVMNVLQVLTTQALAPDFRPPMRLKEWFLHRSLLEGYTLRRRTASVVGRGRHAGVPLSHAEGLTCADVAHTGLFDEHAGDPERNLFAEVEARAAEGWRDRIAIALGAIPPQDLATLYTEIARAETGATATPAHRKRLERARIRARRALASCGITNAVIPDDLPSDADVPHRER